MYGLVHREMSKRLESRALRALGRRIMCTDDAESVGPARPKRAPGGQPGNRNAVKHGLYARDAGIDRRRAVDRGVIETVAGIERALGARLTPLRAALLAHVGRRLLDVAKIDAYEAEIGMPNLGRRGVLPLIEKKRRLLDSITRDLERIGLDAEPT